MPANFDASAPGAARTGGTTNNAAAGVDRNTSIRSIMTLPAYNATPKDTEQVLGRAGDRGGIDTVVQFPDIAEATEEERREEEMEALYQVRLARRGEIAAREERRRERREARDRGDSVALEELRQRGRGESSATLDVLRAEHERVRERARAVSTVSYNGLGVARHDGTRIRANSEESERPLLGDAEGMGAGAAGGGARASTGSFETLDAAWTRGSGGSGGGGADDADLGSHLLQHDAADAAHDDGDDGREPPLYETISLGPGHDEPPDYAGPSARSALGSHPPSRSSSHDLGLGLGLALPEPQQSEVVAPQASHIALPSSPSPPLHTPSHSPSPDLAPQRLSTVARRRASINTLMGGAGRAAVAPQKTTFVLHSPPAVRAGTPPEEARRASFAGMARLVSSQSSASLRSVASVASSMETPSIVVESATPVVGPGMGRGRGGLGWGEERGGGGV